MATKNKVMRPPVATSVAFAARDMGNVTGSGVVGNIARGWNLYSDERIIEKREAAHQRRLDEAAAYFISKM